VSLVAGRKFFETSLDERVDDRDPECDLECGSFPNEAFFLNKLCQSKGILMKPSQGTVCEELFLDLICYEILCGRLSSEMGDLFQRHLEQCPSCRNKVRSFHRILQDAQVVRNFG